MQRGRVARWLMRMIVLLAACVLVCSACLTSRNTKAIEDYRSSIHEFDLALPDKGNFSVNTGTLSMVNGVTVMQFENVLRGARRYLNVESTAQGMRFRESREKLTGPAHAFLVRQITCCMDDRAFREILFLKPGQKAHPADLLRTHFQYTVTPGEFPAALIVMDFSNVYTFSAMHAYWQNGGDVTYFVQAPGTDYNTVMAELAWQERSRLHLAGLYGWYAVTVPVDIVTAPFQLIGLLMLGQGVVR